VDISFARMAKHDYNPLRSIGAWRSPASALAWGARGRRFKSSRPDSQNKTVLSKGRFYFKISHIKRTFFMETSELTIHSPINKQSVLSLVFGILALVFLCLSMIPFPFTGLICFPLSILFGVLSLIFGMISLNQIRRYNETGRPMAWVGIIVGGFLLLCVICMVIAIASLFVFAPNSFHLPPSIQNFHI